MLAITCSSCQKKLSVKDDLAGKKVKCPGCGQVTTVAAKPAVVGKDDLRTVPPAPSLDGPTLPPKLPDASDTPTNPSLSKPDATQGIKPDAGHDSSLTDFLAPPQADDELGRLGDFRILKILGHGGMGVVFLGDDPKLGRKVAIKAMLPHLAESKSSQQRFLREARSAATLEHDHIVPIFHIGVDHGAPYIVMPFLKGEPLDERLKRAEKIPLAAILRIGREIAEALDAAHTMGLVHRDIKPANVWLEAREARSGKRQGDKETGRQGDENGTPLSPCLPVSLSPCLDFRVKILDFGLARAVTGDSELTQQGAVVGTPSYMSPEQGRGETVDARCDLWSLGVVLYRMCAGELPFKGTNALSTLRALEMTNPPPPAQVNAAVPAELSSLVMKLLEKNPADRMSSAAEVVQAIQAIETKLVHEKMATGITETLGEPSPVRGRLTPSSTGPSRGSARRSITFVAVAIVGISCLIGAAGGIYYWQTDNGIVRIEINDPAIKVAFDKNGPIITGVDQKDIKLTPGEFGLTVERGDLKFDTDKFILKRGETITLKIEWVKEGKLQVMLGERLIGKGEPAKAIQPPVIATTPVASAQTNQYALRFDEDARVPIDSVRYDLSLPHTYEAYVTPITRGPRGMIGSPGHSGIGTNGSVWSFNIAPMDPKESRFLTGQPLVLGQKAHVAGVYADGMVRLFVDGKLVREAKTKGLRNAKEGMFQIGGPKEKANFIVSEVRISKVARYTKDFVPQARFEPDADTLALYHCDEGSGDVLKDSSGHGHHGKIVGAKWVKADGSPATSKFPPLDPAWLQAVAAMKPEQQIEAVKAKLMKRNPGFDGTMAAQIESNKAVYLTFNTDHVKDISPVAVLVELRRLSCNGSYPNKGQLADLSPLRGLSKLNILHCGSNPAMSDLSPLQDADLQTVLVNRTLVADLSPLKKLKLDYLDCSSAKVTDLSPIKDMPLKKIGCDFNAERDAAILRSIKTLEKINGKAAAAFWKEVDKK